MNEIELKQFWQSANMQMEANMTIQKQNIEDITKLKVQNFMSSMKPIKFFTLFIGIGWVAIVGSIISNLFIFAYDQVSSFFLFSAMAQVLLTAIAVGVYVYQLSIIYGVNMSESVLTLQEKLSKLRLSTLNITKILFLQLPLWTTFYWNQSMMDNGSTILWIIQILITVTFTIVAVWLFFNIKFENRDKKWFKLIFSGKEWQLILQSMEILNQVEDYKK
jgi:hypothetical protein